MTRQKEILDWAIEMFGPVASDLDERCARFFEEAAELVHSIGFPRDVADRILERVYSRAAGHPEREAGQVQITLEALTESIEVDVETEAKTEFDRIRGIPREEWQRRHAEKAK